MSALEWMACCPAGPRPPVQAGRGHHHTGSPAELGDLNPFIPIQSEFSTRWRRVVGSHGDDRPIGGAPSSFPPRRGGRDAVGRGVERQKIPRLRRPGHPSGRTNARGPTLPPTDKYFESLPCGGFCSLEAAIGSGPPSPRTSPAGYPAETKEGYTQNSSPHERSEYAVPFVSRARHSIPLVLGGILWPSPTPLWILLVWAPRGLCQLRPGLKGSRAPGPWRPRQRMIAH